MEAQAKQKMLRLKPAAETSEPILPPELFLFIVDGLLRSRSKRTLLALASTNRQFYALCLPHLMNCIDLIEDHNGERVFDVEKLDCFGDDALESGKLSFVKSS
jgi:hypothetical protein